MKLPTKTFFFSPERAGRGRFLPAIAGESHYLSLGEAWFFAPHLLFSPYFRTKDALTVRFLTCNSHFSLSYSFPRKSIVFKTPKFLFLAFEAFRKTSFESVDR